MRLENETKNSETRTKIKIERIWMDKLKQSEQTATCDVSACIEHIIGK